jgi:hypothetical protein
MRPTARCQIGSTRTGNQTAFRLAAAVTWHFQTIWSCPLDLLRRYMSICPGCLLPGLKTVQETLR